jgi:HPt (histidine-containing phosphotransfer) domain-containing protein
VTESVERERAELAQREMIAIFRQLVLNSSAFAQFHDEAQSLLESIENASVDDEVLIKRQVHTLKGNSASSAENLAL